MQLIWWTDEENKQPVALKLQEWDISKENIETSRLIRGRKEQGYKNIDVEF